MVGREGVCEHYREFGSIYTRDTIFILLCCYGIWISGLFIKFQLEFSVSVEKHSIAFSIGLDAMR
jgi:hypothetical protein